MMIVMIKYDSFCRLVVGAPPEVAGAYNKPAKGACVYNLVREASDKGSGSGGGGGGSVQFGWLREEKVGV